MKKFKVAIIGCGCIHPLHVAGVQKADHAELVAVCDIDETRAKESAEQNGVKYYTHYKEVLADSEIDAVHITLPHNLHVPVAVDALKAGKHVFSEKPMGATLAQAEELRRAAKKTDKQYGICFQNRYNLVSQKVRELIDSGKPGKILGSSASVVWQRDESYYSSGDWRGKWSTEGGGVLINQAIHTMDLQIWLAGMPVALKGNAFTSILGDYIEVEDTASAVFKYKDDSMRGVYFATNCNAIHTPIRLEIYCENCTIIMDDDLTIIDKEGNKEFVSGSHTLEGEKSYWGTGHASIIKDFYKCLAENKHFPVDIDEGIKTMKLIDAIYTSTKTIDFVTIK